MSLSIHVVISPQVFVGTLWNVWHLIVLLHSTTLVNNRGLYGGGGIRNTGLEIHACLGLSKERPCAHVVSCLLNMDSINSYKPGVLFIGHRQTE